MSVMSTFSMSGASLSGASLSGASLSGVPALPLDLGESFAIVDVETTGLRSQQDRIVQVAISLVDRYGRLERHWHSLVDPERDPGPVHIHGITPERLVGAPRFHEVAPAISRMLAGRVIVAHNAAFDWGFLYAETARSAQSITGGRRLCTLALARRLDLDLPDFTLATLAYWAQIDQQQAHDASDDVRVLHSVFLKLMDRAVRAAVTLPYSTNVAPISVPWPTAVAPRVNSPWQLPGAWTPGTPLLQGMKFVITGGTSVPRDDLYRSAIEAGLVPMNSVSGRTRFLIRGTAQRTNKVARAEELGIPIITEEEFVRLLGAVAPGVPVSGPADSVGRPQPKPLSRGPLSGYRVLVMGGPHTLAARTREQVADLGGRVAVNLTGTVSHVVLLPGAEADPRLALTEDLVRLDPATLQPVLTVTPAVVLGQSADPLPVDETVRAEATVLRRGWVVDLPTEISRWQLYVSWTSPVPAIELDVVAFVTDEHHRVLSDEHFVFYNNLHTPTGDVRLALEADGEGRFSFDLDELARPGVRIVLGAALEVGRTFGELGPVELVLRDRFGRAWVRAVLDAGTSESSLLLAEFYQRGEVWRVRAVGQGYEEDLAAFARRHGVDV